MSGAPPGSTEMPGAVDNFAEIPRPASFA